MAAEKRPATRIEVAVGNGAFGNAVRAIFWAHSWIHIQVPLPRDLSVDGVAEWWNESSRTAFGNRPAFRECSPTIHSPAAIHTDTKQMAVMGKAAALLKDRDLLDAGLLNPCV